LLQRENVLVKIFLKLLVCIVDVELLKAVNLRGMKSGKYYEQKAKKRVHELKYKECVRCIYQFLDSLLKCDHLNILFSLIKCFCSL